MYTQFVKDMNNMTGNCDAFGFDGLSGQEEQEAIKVCESEETDWEAIKDEDIEADMEGWELPDNE